MNRALLVVLVIAACSSTEERARQASVLRQARDSLMTAEVVRALQPITVSGRLIYDPPVRLSLDSATKQ